MAHVSEYKKENVKKFTKLIDNYPIIGIINMENLPTKQLQNMRENLRGKVVLTMTKKRLVKIALKNSKKENIGELEQYLKGMPAILFTKDNPFTLFSTLKKNKSKAPISAGQTAPNNIVVPAGKTSFAPGPVIGELGGFGIKTSVEDGKISIKEDKVVAKEGEVVSGKLAGLLQRLGVEPMEVGLDLVAVYENKEILTKEILDIDEDAYTNDFKTAAAQAFNLAFNAAYPTKDNITLLVQTAAADSKAFAIECDILTSETIGTVFSKAELQANSLNSKLDIKKVEENNSEEDKAKDATETKESSLENNEKDSESENKEKEDSEKTE